MINTYEAAVDFANKLDYAGKNYDAEQVIRWLDGAQVTAGKGVHYGTRQDFKSWRGR